MKSRAKLEVVGGRSAEAKRKLTPEEEAEKQRRREHWANVHIAGDRAPPIGLPRLKSRRRIGSDTRFERGRLSEV